MIRHKKILVVHLRVETILEECIFIRRLNGMYLQLHKHVYVCTNINIAYKYHGYYTYIIQPQTKYILAYIYILKYVIKINQFIKKYFQYRITILKTIGLGIFMSTISKMGYVVLD